MWSSRGTILLAHNCLRFHPTNGETQPGGLFPIQLLRNYVPLSFTWKEPWIFFRNELTWIQIVIIVKCRNTEKRVYDCMEELPLIQTGIVLPIRCSDNGTDDTQRNWFVALLIKHQHMWWCCTEYYGSVLLSVDLSNCFIAQPTRPSWTHLGYQTPAKPIFPIWDSCWLCPFLACVYFSRIPEWAQTPTHKLCTHVQWTAVGVHFTGLNTVRVLCCIGWPVIH